MELMVIHKRDGNTAAKTSDRPMFSFWDSGKIQEVPNDILLQFITATGGYFDISQILIDGESFYNTMYSKLFEDMGLKKEIL